jgi:hypothetical protein
MHVATLTNHFSGVYSNNKDKKSIGKGKKYQRYYFSFNLLDFNLISSLPHTMIRHLFLLPKKRKKEKKEKD